MSDCTAHCERKRGEILPNVQCQARAFRHCVQKLYGGRHEWCALSSNKQTITRSLVRLDTTIPFWILCRVSRVHCLTQKQVVGESV